MTQLLTNAAKAARRSKGSGGATKLKPSKRMPAVEVDDVYQEHLAALPKQTAAIRAGQQAWERWVA